jgi:hypothetical protein
VIDFGFDEDHEDNSYEDEPQDHGGCLFPGECVMPGEHLVSECATAEMMEAIYRDGES